MIVVRINLHIGCIVVFCLRIQTNSYRRNILTYYYTITSVKIIQLNEYGCRDAPCEKSWKQGNPLSNTIKDTTITSTIMRNPLPELCREGLRMIVLVSLLVLLRGFPCFHDLSHGASLHPYLNDFYTCSIYYFRVRFAYTRSYAHEYMRSARRARCAFIAC